MSFHVTSLDVRIEVEPGNVTYLCCASKDTNGNWVPNRMKLDDFIGNSDGWFIWDGHDFTKSALNIRLEQGERGPKLTADLPKRDGGYRERQGIELADRIENQNGCLVYLRR